MSQLDHQLIAVVAVIVILGVTGLFCAWEERRASQLGNSFPQLPLLSLTERPHVTHAQEEQAEEIARRVRQQLEVFRLAERIMELDRERAEQRKREPQPAR